MKKPGGHASSRKAGRKHEADAPNARGSRGPEGRLDAEVERWLTSVEAAFPSSRSSIIPMLQSAQTALGYLPRDAMQAISRHLAVPPAFVEGVASFYAQFRFNKPGLHRIAVCNGTACYVRGGGKLMDDIQVDLGIASGETTADGVVSLESVSCFGTCALAPVVVLDDKVLRQQTSESMKKVMRELSSAPPEGTSREARSSPAGRGARE